MAWKPDVESIGQANREAERGERKCHQEDIKRHKQELHYADVDATRGANTRKNSPCKVASVVPP